MNIPESKPAESPERKALLELKRAHLSLRTMFHLLALCALLLTGTLFAIIFQQVSMLRRQSDELIAHVNEYNKTFVPQIESVRTNLLEFAKTNQSLNPILARYFPTNTSAKPILIGTSSTNR